MTSTAAQRAFRELGYGRDELLNGLPKLDYLYRHDEELFHRIVDRCKTADPAEAQSWRYWFRVHPARRYKDDEIVDDWYLETFRARYHLAPLAVKISAAAMNGSINAVDTLVGSSWQYEERTATGWDGAKVFMIVITLMPSLGKNSEAEKKAKINYVREHLSEVEEIIPEIAEEKIISLDQLRRRLEKDYDEMTVVAGDDATLEA